MNNSFTGYYEPTLEPNVFRRAYHFNEDDPNEKPIFVDLEIVDLFPHDHPFMDEEDATASEASRAMTAHLQSVLNVPYEKQVMDPKISDLTPDEKTGKITEDMYRIHAYIFVFDCSNKRTFDSLMCIIETIHQLEKGKKKGAGGSKKKGPPPFFPKKIVVGNKKDLKVNRVAGGSITKENINELLNLFPSIKVKEVSALTNYNITEVFQQIVKDLDSDPALKIPTDNYFKDVQTKIKGNVKKQAEGEDENGDEKQADPGIAKPDAKQNDGGFFGCCGARGGGAGGQSDGESSDEGGGGQIQDSDDETDTQNQGGMSQE